MSQHLNVVQKKGSEKNASEDKKKERLEARKDKINLAFDFLIGDREGIPIGELAKGIEGQPTAETVKNWLKQLPNDYIKDKEGLVSRVQKVQDEPDNL